MQFLPRHFVNLFNVQIDAISNLALVADFYQFSYTEKDYNKLTREAAKGAQPRIVELSIAYELPHSLEIGSIVPYLVGRYRQ
jgi:hypothetical protein